MNLFKKKPKTEIKLAEPKPTLPLPPEVPKTEMEKLEAADKVMKTEEKDVGEDVVKEPKEQPVEITPEHLVELINGNYLALNQAYNGLVNRFDLLNNKLKNMEDVIHEDWKIANKILQVLEQEVENAKKELEEPKKKK